MSAAEARATKIAVMALGGQGGGVLANWIVAAYERAGYLAQSTSVPGVAQRTGATIYYIEAFPEAAAREAGRDPVLALSPAEGDVDIILAAELMEAVRAIDRGFVATDQTALIASTHRIYTIGEKSALGDGVLSSSAALAKTRAAAKSFVGFDMDAAAQSTGAVISAVMFGALAGSGVAGLDRNAFEDVIRADGRQVDSNLAGFASGFERASDGEPLTAEPQARESGGKLHPEAERRRTRILSEFPECVQGVILTGAGRTADFQGLKYVDLYLDRLKEIREADALAGGVVRNYLLTEEVARGLALWMCYEDAIRVADLKTRAARFSRVRDEAGVSEDQIVHISEFMHPRAQEICELLPAPFGRFLLEFRPARKLIDLIFSSGRRVPTSRLRGFLPLYLLAALQPLRPFSLRRRIEDACIEAWLRRVSKVAAGDYDLAVEIARCQRLIKGYGDTHERGVTNFNRIMIALDDSARGVITADQLSRLRAAALADEEGVALAQALADIQSKAA